MTGVIDGVRWGKRALTGHAVAPALPDAETRIPGPVGPSRVSIGAITVADPDEEARRRRALYEVAASVARRGGGVPVFPALPPNTVPYGFPIYVPPARIESVRAAVRRSGLQLAPWPDLPAAVRAGAPDHYRHLMVMPFLW
jgi:hypothetical protein